MCSTKDQTTSPKRAKLPPVEILSAVFQESQIYIVINSINSSREILFLMDLHYLINQHSLEVWFFSLCFSADFW